MSTIFLQGNRNYEDVLRTSAKHQLESYANEWIVIFEALQNALDATENVVEGRVKVIFDLAENKVTVFDNGKGFPRDKDYFGLGKGDKTDLNDFNIRGEHGVGIKMVILCSRQFELISRESNSNVLWYARFNDGFKFLDSKESEYFNADFKEHDRLPSEYTTMVEYKFPTAKDNPIREISIREFILEIFNQYSDASPFDLYLKDKTITELFISHYFRTHSYSGDVNRLFDSKKPSEIEVLIKEDTSISIEKLEEIYPNYLIEFWNQHKTIKFPAKYWDITELYDNPSRKGILNEEMLRSFNPNRKFGDTKLWVLKITEKEQLKNLLVNPHIQDFYPPGFFNNLIEERIRGIYMVIGSAFKGGNYNINKMIIGKADQIIAADGIITTNQIRTPKRGRNQNYLNNIHFVININERVNYGKQGVKNPQLLSVIYKYFEEIYVKTLVDLAVSVAGKQPKTPAFEEPEIVITELKDLNSNLSIKKVPRHENTLIAIVYELIGQGKIHGIETYQLSSFDQYDGKVNIMPPLKTEFKKIKRDADLMNIEFKLNLTDLIDDFETNIKVMSELSLIVLWNKSLPPGNTKYNILDLENSTYSGLKIEGVTEVLSNMDGSEVPILEISNLLKVDG
jgi:hypothetical protein